jgi:hypothetical protein
MNAVDRQLRLLQGRHPGARIENKVDGHQVLVVPDVPTGLGWNRDRVEIAVIIPVGYPQVRLDCFYAAADLRLASGAEPGNSSSQTVFGRTYRWFSWHVASWDPARDGLDQYVRFCESRLREAR